MVGVGGVDHSPLTSALCVHLGHRASASFSTLPGGSPWSRGVHLTARTVAQRRGCTRCCDLVDGHARLGHHGELSAGSVVALDPYRDGVGITRGEVSGTPASAVRSGHCTRRTEPSSALGHTRGWVQPAPRQWHRWGVVALGVDRPAATSGGANRGGAPASVPPALLRASGRTLAAAGARAGGRRRTTRVRPAE
jgi:hypothetical protein